MKVRFESWFVSIALSRVKKTFRPFGNYEGYGFDDLGNRTHFWNADRKTTTFGMDAQGRVTSITNAIGKVTSFSFDDAGNLFSRKDAKNAETFYGYDLLNRLSSITNGGIEVATFDHDPIGNILKHEDSKVEFGFGEMNQLTNSLIRVYSRSFAVQYSFDHSGPAKVYDATISGTTSSGFIGMTWMMRDSEPWVISTLAGSSAGVLA